MEWLDGLQIIFIWVVRLIVEFLAFIIVFERIHSLEVLLDPRVGSYARGNRGIDWARLGSEAAVELGIRFQTL